MNTHTRKAGAVSNASAAALETRPVRAKSVISDGYLLHALCNLFAGRTPRAFGEDLEWWAETFQCDLSQKDAAGLLLVSLSDHPADQLAGAAGVSELRKQLLSRARMLIERAGTEAQP